MLDLLQQSGVSVRTQTIIPTSQDALEQVIIAKGNLPLAAERLGCTQADVVKAIQPHLDDLKSYMQVVATLELFSFMPILHKTLVENLSALEPSDAVNAYLGLMKLISAKTDTKQIDVNINEFIWKQVPRELQQLMLEEAVA